MARKWYLIGGSVSAAVLVVVLSGCNNSDSENAPTSQNVHSEADGAHGHGSGAHGESHMPSAKTSEEDRKLFLTAGGRYTEADVKANGNTVPDIKFAGIRAVHDSKPKPGQKICPISDTVSNPKFTWIIGGEAYEFCCPPCIGEFLETAKKTPDQIKSPESYRAK
jgi:hypothetical protein